MKATLINLKQLLNKELKNYTITVDGIQTVSEVFYLQQKVVCEIPDFYSKVFQIFAKMQQFFEEKNIVEIGHPMVIFDSHDIPQNQVKFNVCFQIPEEIFTSPESEVTCVKRTTYDALKVTLKGDYSHSKKAWDKGFAYLQANNLVESETGRPMEVYVKSSMQTQRPSEWITEIFIPVKSIETIVSPNVPAIID